MSDEYVGADGSRGPTAFAAVMTRLRGAFPDLHYTLEELVAEGDRVVVRWTLRGTHTGPFRDLAPTGKKIANNGVAIFRIADGKIVHATVETDRLGFLMAIGRIPYDPSFGPPPRASSAQRNPCRFASRHLRLVAPGRRGGDEGKHAKHDRELEAIEIDECGDRADPHERLDREPRGVGETSSSARRDPRAPQGRDDERSADREHDAATTRAPDTGSRECRELAREPERHDECGHG